MGLLKNKIAIVTGGARGIGKAVARQFIDEGAKVIITDINENSGIKTADSIGGYFFKADISDEKNVKSLFEHVKAEFSKLDILVNNAGILKDSTLRKLQISDFDAVIDANLRGTYLCGKEAAEIMGRQGSGVILNAASVVAHNGNFGQTNYVASKTGVIGMTKVWARELGKDGVRVNAVAPGFIQTGMTSEIPEKVMKMMSTKVPLKRWGNPEDVANAYVFLASEKANYITGAILNVDGGVVV